MTMPGIGYFVVSGKIDFWMILTSIPIMMYGLYSIFAVEMPNYDADRRSRKRNLVARRGMKERIFRH